MDFPFPLLGPRQGHRHHYGPESPWHHCLLEIPESTSGRVRLQLTIPWRELGSGEHIISVALTWPKLNLPPRDLKGLAEDVWKRLVPGKYERTDRSSLVGSLVRVSIKFNRWRAELFIRREDRQLIELLIREEERVAELVSSGAIDFAICTVREQAIGSLVAGLEWATRFFHPGWSREKDKAAWVYRAHLKTAMLVAEEVADLYLENSPLLTRRKYLDVAFPTLKKRISDAYRSATVTARRLALALVDIKFENLFPDRLRLLDPNRLRGLDDATLWSMLLPPDNRDRLIRFRPAPSVQEMMSWPKAKTRDNEAAKGFCNWWVCLVEEPLRPLYPLTDIPLNQRNYIAFLEFPGVERWASIVWDALHGPKRPISSD